MRHVEEKTLEDEIAFCEQQSHYHAQQYLYYSQKLIDLKQTTRPVEGRMPMAANDKGDRADTDVTDEQWDLIFPLIHSKNRYGRPMVDPRRVLNGILFVMGHDCACNKMPKRYGSYVTCWRRLLHWQNKGIWHQIEHILVSARITMPPLPSSVNVYNGIHIDNGH
jgi:transposase